MHAVLYMSEIAIKISKIVTVLALWPCKTSSSAVAMIRIYAIYTHPMYTLIVSTFIYILDKTDNYHISNVVHLCWRCMSHYQKVVKIKGIIRVK